MATSSKSANTVRKTANATTVASTTPDPSIPGAPNNPYQTNDAYTPAAEKNILHRYSSWTYNFAIGAISPRALADQSLLESDINKFAVLNSAGKGTTGVGINTEVSTTSTNVAEVQALVDGFNTSSPGRFDMFIDNVVIDTLVNAGSKETGTAVATNITFDVYEPYSMNGFMEALQVSAKAAGYADYMKGVFAIRVQFRGYSSANPDKPVIVPKSTRFFLVYIHNVKVDVNESGTRYHCECTPYTQMGFGTPNTLLTDIKIPGNNVGESLANLFQAVNKMIQNNSAKTKDTVGFNTYQISVPKLLAAGEKQNVKAAILTDGKVTNEYQFTDLLESKMNDNLKSTNTYQFADPSNPGGSYVDATDYTPSLLVSKPTKSKDKLIPRTPVSTFKSSMQIHECIAAIVRDSA